MKKIPKNIAGKIQKVAKSVILDLKKKGHIVPIKKEDGTIQYENFFVLKNDKGFYQVKNKYGRIYADNINLPQTAALLAHSLALGKSLDEKLIEIDKNYGYRAFDEDVFKAAQHRNSNDIDLKIFYQTRYDIARQKKNQFRSQIMSSFRKLTSIA
jgi:hypothetical protein